ncbi:MAG TPA: aminoglycoside phosphotransferase family protein [Fimbriimonadaceae bacterium]|nr:aminoglycoside phosphotransferase family protein [Fimbriimonadaceae bacterium]
MGQRFAIEDSQARAILRKHGFSERGFAPSRFLGEANFVWLTHEVALRVCTDSAYERDVHGERRNIPIALACGMPAPRLLVVEEDRDIVPTLATIYERVEGVPFGAFPLTPAQLTPIAEQLARHLFDLHGANPRAHGPPKHEWDEIWVVDYAHDLEVASGHLSPEELAWARDWCGRLAQVPGPEHLCFVHRDIHSTNILIDNPESPQRVTAILDWSDGGRGDHAEDLALMPPELAPLFVRAYREVSGCDDPTLEGRVLRILLESALFDFGEPETGLPLYFRGRATWNSLLRLVEHERDGRWRQWFPR